MLCCILKSTAQFQWIIVLWIVGIYATSTNSLITKRGVLDRNLRLLCKKPDPIPNGEVRFKRGGAVMRHICNYGYTLIGARNTPCVLGKWQGGRPVCARSGCNPILDSRENGVVQLVKQYEIALFCSEGYNVAGNRFAYCNGTEWDRRLGECRKRQNKVEHECDFETDDICGWVSDQLGHFHWKRVMAANVFTSFQTGPRHDHTTMTASGGHYMIMESYGDTNSTIALTSPIYKRDLSLKTACCFRFYYFMYGSGVGNLDVLIRPISLSTTEIHMDRKNFVKFHKSGNQNNIWNEALFNIDEMDDDFQIVFLASGSKSHLSDIAIDDVKLMIGTECKTLGKPYEEPDDSSEYETTTTEETLFDTQSCVSHCGVHASGIMRRDGALVGICSCHLRCIEDNNCCPDFVAVCLDGDGTYGDSDGNTNDPLTRVTYTGEKKEVTTTIKIKSDNTIKTTATHPSSTTSITTINNTTQKPSFIPIATTITKKPTTTTSKKSTTSTTIITTKKLNISTTKSATTITTTKKITSTTAMTTTTKKPRTTTARKLSTQEKTTIKTTTVKANDTTAISKKTIPITTLTSTIITTTEKSREVPTVKPDRVALFTEKSTLKFNNTKGQVWTWENKEPTKYNAYKSPSSTILVVFFGFFLAAIIVGAIYRQRKAAFVVWLEQLLGKSNGTGAEDSSSIIANFTSKENAKIGHANTCMKFSKPNGKQNCKTKSNRSNNDQQSLTDDQPFEFLNDNDGIPLL